MNGHSADTERRRRFEQLVANHYRDLYRYAAWLSRDPGVAEVVLQESMLRAWKSFDLLRDDAAARHWLLTIVRRENARYFASPKIETVDMDHLTPGQQQMMATTDDTDIEEMREAIFDLDDEYREALVLQVLIGYSTSEIAEILGIKQGAVLTRLHRARHKLRNRMKQAVAA